MLDIRFTFCIFYPLIIKEKLETRCTTYNICKGCYTEGYDVTTFEFPSQKKEGKGGWEPSFASNLILNFRVLIQPYSSSLVNNFCWGGWALLSVSKLERQRTSGPQKRTKSDFMYCSQHLGASSRNPRRNPQWYGPHTSTSVSVKLAKAWEKTTLFGSRLRELPHVTKFAANWITYQGGIDLVCSQPRGKGGCLDA